MEDSLAPKLKPVFYRVLDERRKVTLPDGKEVTQSELSHLQMQGLYREYKIIQVRFYDDNIHKQSYANQRSDLKVESQNPLPEYPTYADTTNSTQTSIIDTNPTNESIGETSSLVSSIQQKKRHSNSSPLTELFT